MKITFEQLPEQLQTRLQGAYWLASDEVFLKQMAADMIRARTKHLDYVRTVFHVDTQFNWDSVYQTCNNRSLFSSRQLLELHFPNKLSEPDRKALQNCLSYLHDDLCLMILSGKIETQSQKTKWFDALTKPLCFVPIWPITPEQYTGFLKKRSAHYQVSLTDQALQLLAQQTQGNVLAADQVLQQLRLVHASAPISAAQLMEVSGHNRQTDLFAFVDVFLSAPQQALQDLQLLKNQDVEPILIIWALARELRLINNLLLAIAQGATPQAALQAQFVWPSRQGLLLQACKRFSQNRIYTLMTQLATLDLNIKGVERANPWIALERLLIC